MEKEIVAEDAVVTKDSQTEGNQSDETVTEDVPVFESEAGTPEPGASEEEDKAKTPAGEGEEVVAAKTIYTPEELEELLRSEGDVDTSRLSAEGRVVMKSFQRGYDKKFQQMAEMRKSVEAQMPKAPREQLFDRYMGSPAEVVAEINAEIGKLEAVDPTDERYAESRKTIVALQALKDDFSIRRQSVIEHGQRVGDIVTKTEAAIAAAIPDFAEKAPRLTKFAEGLGFSSVELRALTDPTVVGPLAYKMTMAINQIYDKLNAPKTAEKKVKKDAPLPLQRGTAGRTLEKKAETDDPGSLPMGEYLLRRKKFAE